jgi:spore maturation protein CgeB
VNDPLKKYRQRFRIWRNDRRLEREDDRYGRLFAVRRLAVPDDAAIGQAAHRRFPRLVPRRKGQLRILAVYHHYNWEDTALKPALERFGSVRHYDWMTAFRPGLAQWRRSLRGAMNEDLLRYIRGAMETGGVDCLFAYLSGEQISPAAMATLQAFPIPTINLALNDRENFVGKIRGGEAMGMRDICRFFTLCWTSTEDALPKYCVEGALPIYLPEGANPEIHRPYERERTIDVSFIGQRYGNREEMIRRLRQAGIAVEVYGYGWPNGALDTDAMVEMYSRSRINLGFGGVIGHTGAYCLKGRDFEVPMSGGLYLTEYHPELARAYDLEREIVTYRGFDDLREKIHDLLLHPAKAEDIRRRGHERARREHSWEMRLDRIFRLLGLIE